MDLRKKNKEIIAKLQKLGSQLHILVVEDDEVLLQQLLQLLKKFFARVDSAKNGLEALNRLSERPYDIVLTDLTMPLIDGFVLIQEIRKNDRKQTILVLSAHSQSEELLKLINMGIDGFLLKPVDTDLVLQKLYQTSLEICNNTNHKSAISFEQKLKRDKEPLSATEFATLYPNNRAYVNEELKGLEDRFHFLLMQSEKIDSQQNLENILDIFQDYALQLTVFREFGELCEEIASMIQELKTLYVTVNIEIWIPSFLLLIENLKRLREGVFESYTLQNIYTLNHSFANIFSQIQKDKENTLALLEGLLA